MNGLTEVSRIFDRMFRDFDSFWDSQTFSSPYIGSTFPPVNVWIDEKDYSLTFEFAVAGIPKDQVKVTFDGDYMTVETDYGEERAEGRKCLKQGIKRGYNKVRYVIPASKYDTTEAIGKVKDGILTVKVPAKESTKPKQLLLG